MCLHTASSLGVLGFGWGQNYVGLDVRRAECKGYLKKRGGGISESLISYNKYRGCFFEWIWGVKQECVGTMSRFVRECRVYMKSFGGYEVGYGLAMFYQVIRGGLCHLGLALASPNCPLDIYLFIMYC